jgi:hypothetical protein
MSTDAAAAPSDEPEIEVTSSEEEPKKKKKRKYSKGPMKLAQKAEIRVSKGLHRVARAVEEGLGVWRERRDESSGKKRDGALRDALKNYGKAVTKFHKVGARLPQDLTENLPKFRFF